LASYDKSLFERAVNCVFQGYIPLLVRLHCPEGKQVQHVPEVVETWQGGGKHLHSLWLFTSVFGGS